MHVTGVVGSFEECSFIQRANCAALDLTRLTNDKRQHSILRHLSHLSHLSHSNFFSPYDTGLFTPVSLNF